MRSCCRLGLILVAPAALAAQSIAARVTTPADRQLVTALVAIEDSRDTVILGNDVRRRGLASANSFIRTFAARGLGRLERRSMIEILAPSLADSVPQVRAAAADAIAQSAARSGEDLARRTLEGRLAIESDSSVRSMLFESLGRLRQGSVAQFAATAGLLLTGLNVPSERHGAIRGLFFLSRKPEARTAGSFPEPVAQWAFGVLVLADSTLTSEDRANLAGVLVNTGSVDEQRLDAMATRGDPYVRDRAVAALMRVGDTAFVRKIYNSASGDGAAIVRYRALTVFARRLRGAGCGPLLLMAPDRDPTVSLAAIDALSGCRNDSGAVRFLDEMASQPIDATNWHRQAHAMVALSALAPSSARPLLARYATHANFFVRMYADSAARLLADTAALYRLARDPHPNVRSGAINGLSSLVGHAADSVYVAALSSDDNQLLMSATRALRGAGNPGVVRELMSAWTRLYSTGRETSGDGLKALADRIIELGGGDHPAATTPRKSPTPTFDDLAGIERLTATIEMADGSVIEFKLHPFDAPTNSARFVRLARAGTFDGLTFHRVAPFFVVQGPSPDANEYSAPDAPFTRDELGRSNLRGTVGLSTRGRDTGDGQFYVNLVDNVYLDHEYTVMGTITRGLEAFDRMQEGAKIRRISVK